MIRVELPYHLRTLAQLNGTVTLEVDAPVTLRRVLDALEARYPVLRGTIRDHDTLKRRPFLRFFACEEDWSHEPVDTPLPEAIATGKEPLLVIGAIAGGGLAVQATALHASRTRAVVGNGNSELQRSGTWRKG
ncbi:MAG: MoaD/ThiS family protein [Acidobacteriaceae bacterium]